MTSFQIIHWNHYENISNNISLKNEKLKISNANLESFTSIYIMDKPISKISILGFTTKAVTSSSIQKKYNKTK